MNFFKGALRTEVLQGLNTISRTVGSLPKFLVLPNGSLLVGVATMKLDGYLNSRAVSSLLWAESQSTDYKTSM